jgi:hypothetical protein
MSDGSGANQVAHIAGALFCLLIAGCAGVERAPSQEPPQTATIPAEPATEPPPPVVAAPPATPVPQAEPSAVEPPAPPETPAPPPPPPEPVRAPTPAAPPPAAPTPAAPRPPPAGVASGTASARPAAPAKPPTPAPTSSAPSPPVSKVAAAPVASKPPAPPLDLASLETRLRETRAIGVFTKVSLKNQVDDLLDKFRAYYKRQSNTTLAELRRPYDMLLLKTLSLLQDSDPALARDIVASREAIWGILADRDKFVESNLMAGG